MSSFGLKERIPEAEALSKPYDATLKAILEIEPDDWPRLTNTPAKRAEVFDADVSTVTAATDKVLRLYEPDAILALDFQSGPDPRLPQRVHTYNALLGQRHNLPVQSVVVLLQPKAKLRSINGIYKERFPQDVRPYLSFRY